jgi:hypothetical protein
MEREINDIYGYLIFVEFLFEISTGLAISN